jgi:hypothetical protein
MRVRTILLLATLFLTCLTVAAWSEPLTPELKSRPADSATSKASVSGRISSIGDASFSVDVKKDQGVVTIQFLIDDDTRVSGKLDVGSMAIVDYRTDDGNNIASKVEVRKMMNLR